MDSTSQVLSGSTTLSRTKMLAAQAAGVALAVLMLSWDKADPSYSRRLFNTSRRHGYVPHPNPRRHRKVKGYERDHRGVFRGR